MKSKQPPTSFLVPSSLGRSESDMVAYGHGEQLDLFRKDLPPRTRLQIYAMMGLSDQNNLDKTQSAKIADILRAMGYNPDNRADGKIAFPPWMYDAIIETVLELYRTEIPLFIREKGTSERVSYTPDKKPIYKRIPGKKGLLFTRILAECGFYYEDEKGQPIDLEEVPNEKRIKYESATEKGNPVYAIPMTDEKGNVIRNKDGTPRRKAANGIWWDWQARIRRMTEDRSTSWVFYLEAVHILRQYLTKPTSFRLIEKTLFWKGKTPQIEMSYDTLAVHLGIKTRDRRQVEAAIDAAFADALTEGIIDNPVTVTPSGYYQPTPKTKRPRRVNQVYRWKRATKWQPGENLISVADDKIDTNIDNKPEIMKDGKAENGL